jgi:type II secretory pathway component PulF
MSSTDFFRATLLRPDGSRVVRPYFVSTEREARREAILSGAQVMSIEKLAHGAWWQREIYTAEYKREFLRSIMFFVETGMSPTESLLRVMSSEANPRKRTEFAPAIEVIHGGGRFGQAIEQTGMFDPTLLLMLRAGELIGIRKVVPAIETLMEARAKLGKFMATIASVLSLELFTAVSSALTIKMYGLPFIEKSFAPAANATAAEKTASQAMHDKLGHVALYTDAMLLLAVLVVLAIAGGVAAWFFWPASRERISLLLRALPGGRALIYHAHLSDGYGVAASLLDSGVPLTAVLNTLSSATSNALVARYWAESSERIRQGLPVAAALSDAQVLTEAETVALHAHRNASQLARVARSIAERRAHQAQMARMRFLKITTLVTIGYIMAVVAAAVWMMMVQDEGMGMMMKAIG